MANRLISALLEHKFDLSQMGTFGPNEICYSPELSVVHNSVRLSFQIVLKVNDSRKGFKDYLGVYFMYLDGPAAALKLSYAFYLAKRWETAPSCIVNIGAEKEIKSQKRLGSGKFLPGTFAELESGGYLSRDALLHAFFILCIPEAAFEDPKRKCSASCNQNSFNRHLYLQTETPTTTNWPFCTRFELISNDDRHFWVHKEVLTLNSDTFAQMFDPEKPEEARFNYSREGRMTFLNVSGGALKEMVSYLYLRQTTPDLDQFAMELFPFAEMYGLEGLTLLCASMLMVQVVNEQDMAQLLCLYEFSHLHKVASIWDKCGIKLMKAVMAQNKNDVDRGLLLRATAQAHKHNSIFLEVICENKLVEHIEESEDLTAPIVLDLATEAHKYSLTKVTRACGQWLNKDWKKVSKYAQLNDIFGEIFARLMTLAQD